MAASEPPTTARDRPSLRAGAAVAAALVHDTLSGHDDSAISRRTAAKAFTIRVASAAIAYLSQVLLARWMGDFDYGIFVAVWVGIVILGGLACLGFQTTIIRYVTEYATAGDHAHLRGVLRGSLLGALLASSLMAGIGIALVWALADTISHYYVLPLALAVLTLPMLALQEVQDGIARARDWTGLSLGLTYILRPVLILVLMALARLAGLPADAPHAMTAALIAVWLTSLVQFVWLRHRLGTVVTSGPRRYQAREWLAVAMPIFLVEAFYNLMINVDVLLVGWYLPPDQVGLYFAAAKTLALVHFVQFAVKAAAAHRFAAYRGSGDGARYRAFVAETTHWVFWPSAAMTLAMVLVGPWLLALFGPHFAAGEPLLWILAVGIMMRSSVGAAESVLTMSGEQRACALAYAGSLTVGVVLGLSFIPTWGLIGAAVATTCALAFEAFALEAAARRRLGLSMFVLSSMRLPGTAAVLR